MQMKRLKCTIIHSSVSEPQLHEICQPQPGQCGFVSEMFPLDPIEMTLRIHDPVFNKVSFAFRRMYTPLKMTVEGSSDGVVFKLILTATDLQPIYNHLFESTLSWGYLRVRLYGSTDERCNVIKIVGIQCSYVTMFAMRFACELAPRLIIPPVTFATLQQLQIKAKTMQSQGNPLYVKYNNHIQSLLDNPHWAQTQLAEPINHFQLQEDPQSLSADIQKLRNKLIEKHDQYISPHALEYFKPYKQILPRFLVLVSSAHINEQTDGLYLFYQQFCIQNKKEENQKSQKGALAFFIYYIEFLGDTHISTACKILTLFLTKIHFPQNMVQLYERLLFNLLKRVLSHPQVIPLIYNLFILLPPSCYIGVLMSDCNNLPLVEKLARLQILEKLTYRNIAIDSIGDTCQFLNKVLKEEKITLKEKNRVYNIIAYMAAQHSKSQVLDHFQHLNAMLLLPLDRIVDKKIKQIKVVPHEPEETKKNNCEYCGVVNAAFGDENLFDLHVEKECICFYTCDQCQTNVDIVQLFKHKVNQCTFKHEFMNCHKCNDCILRKEEQIHLSKCSTKLNTKCPLCLSIVENKLKLKQHIISGCPNNPRK